MLAERLNAVLGHGLDFVNPLQQFLGAPTKMVLVVSHFFPRFFLRERFSHQPKSFLPMLTKKIHETLWFTFLNRCHIAFLSVLLLLTANSDAQVSLGHTFDPSRTYPPDSLRTSPYGLVDLDAFSPGLYRYCRWGNYLFSSVNFNFSSWGRFTAHPWNTSNTDLFALPSLLSLNGRSYPDSWSWSLSPDNIRTPGESHLLRRLHFKESVIDVKSKNPINREAKKIIVLIHGWNPFSSEDSFKSGEWAWLQSQIAAATANAPDWKLVLYHWEPDADTGPAGGVSSAEYGTRAAEIAHQHGQHLGELLDTLTEQRLEKVHFIAHSAGSWAARSASKYLLTARRNSPSAPPVKLQITLLDPFIPGVLFLINGNTALEKARMSEVNEWFYNGLPLSTGDNLFRLENYYAVDTSISNVLDLNFTVGTQESFGWRSGIDIDQRVDWDQAAPTNGGTTTSQIFTYYRDHSGPIAFYGDTVANPTLTTSVTEPGLQNPAFAGKQGTIGWRQSMFYQEPQIATQISANPPLTQTLSPGQPVTFTASAVKRGSRAPIGFDYLWQELPSGNDPKSSNAPWTPAPGINNTATYSIASPTLAKNGYYYRLLVSNSAGQDVTEPVSLKVAETTTTVPSPPTGLKATPASYRQIDLLWFPGTANTSGFLLQRRKLSTDTFQTIMDGTATAFHDNDPALLPSTPYTYQVIAKGTPPSDATPPVTATTLPANSIVKLLTVTSSNPASGVRIYIGPNDINGSADGDTSLTRQYSAGTDVTLVVQPTWNGSSFLKWQKDGQDYSLSTVTDVIMDTSHTMTAVYAPSIPATYTIAVSASPSIGGAVTGNATYAANATASIQATANPGYTFLNWTRNASAQNGGQTFAVQPQVTFPATSNLSLVANFSQDANNNYTLSLTAEPPGGGTVTGAGSYPPLSMVTATALPAAGYVFDYWTKNGVVINYNAQNGPYNLYGSEALVAHFHVPAPGSVPDILPKITSYPRYSFAGKGGSIGAAVKNRGTLASNPFWIYFRISDSNTVMPPDGNLGFFSAPGFTGIGIPIGVEGGVGCGFTFPSNIPPGDYFFWMLTDPEGADGEPAANRADNNIVAPFTILPPPTFDGPDLSSHDFSIAPSVTTVGGTISVQGGIRNVGNANSTAANAYVSISQSATIPPDKNALNTSSPIAALGIYEDFVLSQSIVLPNTVPAGNYFIWIMVDPEGVDGEPNGNRGNNIVVLPLTIVNPPQTYAIAANADSNGSVTGAGVYSSSALVPLIAVPSLGYAFLNWTEGGSVVSTDSTYAFEAASNRTLVAHFVSTANVTLDGINQFNYYDGPVPGVGEIRSTNAIPGFFEFTNGGTLGKTHHFRGGAMLLTKVPYYLPGCTAEFIWSGSGGSSFMQPVCGTLNQPWPTDANTVDTGMVIATYGNSYNGSWVATPGTVYRTRILFTDNTWNLTTTDFATGQVMGSSNGNSDFTGTVFLYLRTGDTYDNQNSYISLKSLKLFDLVDAPTSIAGPPDPGFSPISATWPTGNASGSGLAIQPDGKIVVVGAFTALNGQSPSNIARLNPDGTLESTATFNPGSGADGYVDCVAVQPDGKILIAGARFSNVNSQARNHIARLNADGTLEGTTTFNPGAGIGGSQPYVFCMVVQPDGKIILAGEFTSVDGQPRSGIARLNPDGSVESTTTFNPGFGASDNLSGTGRVVSAALQPDGKIILVGGFNTFNGQVRNHIVRLNSDGSLESTATFNPGLGPNDSTQVVAVQPDGKILIGGYFTAVNGQPRNGIARLNPDGSVESTTTFNAGTGLNSSACTVQTIALQADGRILICGDFSAVDGHPRKYVARLNADGSLESTSTFNLGSGVIGSSLAGLGLQADGKILIVGPFTGLNHQSRNVIARLNNDAGIENLFTPNLTKARWNRIGALPEVQDVTFDLSTNGGGSWTRLGGGSRIAGGWECAGLSLPSTGLVRARGRLVGGYHNGSSGFIEMVADIIANPNPTAFLPFTAGSTADITGNGYDGTPQNVTPGQDRFGTTNNAMQFDGASSRIEIGKILPMLNQQTFLAWVKPTALGGLQPIVDKAVGGYGGEIDFQMFLQADGTITWLVNTDDGATGLFASATGHIFLAVNQWSHVAGVIDQAKNEVRLYVNGVLDATGTMGGRTVRNTNRPIRFGHQNSNQAVRYFNGLLDDIGIYSRTLTPFEILTKFADTRPIVGGVVAGNLVTTSGTSAVLSANVNPYGQATTTYFEYGLTSAYGSTAAVSLLPDDGMAAQAVSANITGLTENAIYHFRITATNLNGTRSSADNVFTPVTPIGNWRQMWFGTTNNTGISASTANPSNDGIPNILKFALGLDPTRSTTTQLPQAVMSQDGYLSFDFFQPSTVSGVTYGAEWCETLQSNDWHSIPDTGGGGLHHRFSESIVGHSNLFIRLKVTGQ